MSKPSSGLFHSTKGSNNERIIPGEPCVVTGGNSTALGRSMLSSMGVSKKLKWLNYQAQHIIPKELSEHPVLKKIGMHLDHFTNGIFLRTPGDNVSALTRHRGYHAPYNEFVRSKLDQMDISSSDYILQKQVRELQNNLRKLQTSGIPIYPKQGATISSLERAYNRISQRK